jgi:N-acetylneuraminic acid mutarotase
MDALGRRYDGRDVSRLLLRHALSAALGLAALSCTARVGYEQADVRRDPAGDAGDRAAGDTEPVEPPAWAWRGGTEALNVNPVFPAATERGQLLATNAPGSRVNGVALGSGETSLWLFGGTVANGVALRSDVWRFDVATDMWAWMGGPTATDPLPSYSAPASSGGKASGTGVLRRDVLVLVAGIYRIPTAPVGTQWRATNATWEYAPASDVWALRSGLDDYDAGNPPVPGTTGTPAPGNLIGPRYSQASWVDAAGRLWVFGGFGRANNLAAGNLNDLWRLESNDQWVFLGGPTGVGDPGTFVIRGEPGGWPASFNQAPSTWVGADGRLWMFGGAGGSSAQYFSDLWYLDPGNLTWTWVRGPGGLLDKLGIYGTLGVPDPASHPGARCDAAAWVGADGDLYLFGGDGFGESGARGALNDLWVYRIALASWVWLGGPSTTEDAGSFGATGDYDVSNWPPARSDALAWSDGAGGVWLYGGVSFAGRRADLWHWRP